MVQKSLSPLVSVQMITFNNQEYVNQAINSILKQKTEFHYELVITDDHSTDHTPEIIKEYLKNYPDKIRAYFNEKNLGPIKNRIYNFSKCNGKFIAFLDGDDYWSDENKLQKQVNFLHQNPEFRLVYSNYGLFDEKTNKTLENKKSPFSVNFPYGNIFNKLLINNYITTLTVLVHKETIQKALMSLGSDIYDFGLIDKPLWLEISRLSKIGVISDVTGIHRINSESYSRSNNLRKRYNYLKSSWDVILYFLNKYQVDIKSLKEIYKRYYKTMVSYGYRLNDKDIIRSLIDSSKENNYSFSTRQKLKIILVYLKNINLSARLLVF